MREVPIPTADKLELKLALFREINQDFEDAKRRAQYLGRWCMLLSGEIMMLRHDLRDELKASPEGQLKLADVPRYEGMPYAD